MSEKEERSSEELLNISVTRTTHSHPEPEKTYHHAPARALLTIQRLASALTTLGQDVECHDGHFGRRRRAVGPYQLPERERLEHGTKPVKPNLRNWFHSELEFSFFLEKETWKRAILVQRLHEHLLMQR